MTDQDRNTNPNNDIDKTSNTETTPEEKPKENLPKERFNLQVRRIQAPSPAEEKTEEKDEAKAEFSAEKESLPEENETQNSETAASEETAQESEVSEDENSGETEEADQSAVTEEESKESKESEETKEAEVSESAEEAEEAAEVKEAEEAEELEEEAPPLPAPSPEKKPQKTKLKTPKDKSNSLWTLFKASVASEFKPISLNSLSPVERRKQQVLLLRRQRGAAGTLLLFHALIAIFLIALWALLPQSLLKIHKDQLNGYLFYNLLGEVCAVLLPTYLVLRFYKMDRMLVMGRTSHRPFTYILGFLTGVPLALAFTGINNISLYALNLLGFSPQSSSLFGQIPKGSPLMIILIFLVTAFIPAVGQEFMFRGLIQSSLSLSGRHALSIFLTATAFALFQSTPFFILAPFLAGLYLSYMRDKSDNLYITMGSHLVMKITFLIVQPILPMVTSSLSIVGSGGKNILYASIIATLVSLVVLLPLTSYFLNLAGEGQGQKTDPLYRRLRQEQWFPADWKYMLGLLILFFMTLAGRA
jgi:membrane protease YdiL (CAAX protease family)